MPFWGCNPYASAEMVRLRTELDAELRRNGRLEARLEFYCVLSKMKAQLGALLAGQERTSRQMATIQELQDALAEQNDAILAEIVEINAELAKVAGVPDSVVASVKAHTETIKGIIADPLPPVDPV